MPILQNCQKVGIPISSLAIIQQKLNFNPDTQSTPPPSIHAQEPTWPILLISWMYTKPFTGHPSNAVIPISAIYNIASDPSTLDLNQTVKSVYIWQKCYSCICALRRTIRIIYAVICLYITILLSVTTGAYVMTRCRQFQD